MKSAESSSDMEANTTLEKVLISTSDTHVRWFKHLIGLGALEAKIWVASSAQLLALMCGVVFLIVTSWLLIIATAAVIAWSLGYSLVSILSIATVTTLSSAIGLTFLVRRTINKMEFGKILNAMIPTEPENKEA